MNIGFIGAGQIANTMAHTMQRMEDVNLYAVAARDLDRAEAFAAQYGFEKPTAAMRKCFSTPMWSWSTLPPPTPTTRSI